MMQTSRLITPLAEEGRIMHQNYKECLEYLENAGYEEVNGCDFYRDIFPDNQRSGDYQPPRQPNAIYLYKDDERAAAEGAIDRKFYRRLMLKDTWEDDYIDYVEGNPMTLCSGLAYRGLTNTLGSARAANALIFDLDGVTGQYLEWFFDYCYREYGVPWALPFPTYLVLSGSGLHVYYVFDVPVDLYPNIKLQMKKLKLNLASQIWRFESTSDYEVMQCGCISQGFRMVGSFNEKYGTEVRAFRVGDRVTLEYLNKYAKPENRVDITARYTEKKMTLAAAKENHPKWYQDVIVDGKNLNGQWYAKRDLYDWFKRKIDDEEVVIGGRRYWYMHMLAVYAKKCGKGNVPEEELDRDMQWAFEILKKRAHKNELTQDDVEAARKAYNKRYVHKYTIEKIDRRTGIRIARNKRNGRNRYDNLRRARAVQNVDYPNGEWRGHRPSAQKVVEEYLLKNPEATKKECIISTGLSQSTVYKWWISGAKPETKNEGC